MFLFPLSQRVFFFFNAPSLFAFLDTRKKIGGFFMAINKIKEIINEKNPDLSDEEKENAARIDFCRQEIEKWR